MASTRTGPELDANSNVWGQAQDLFFDVVRWREIDSERVSDSQPTPGRVDSMYGQTGRTQASSGFTIGKGAAWLFGGAIVVGLGWAATQ